jgi:hypothetical protein
LKDGVLYRLFKNKVCEVPVVSKQNSLMKELHEISGHVGSSKLYGYLREYYYWPNMF